MVGVGFLTLDRSDGRLACDCEIVRLERAGRLMMRAHLITVLAGLAFACWCLNTARSEQLRIALVISNGRYASMPGLARCTASGTTVRDALPGRGFEVMERSHLRRGECRHS